MLLNVSMYTTSNSFLVWSHQENGKRLAVGGKDNQLGNTTREGLGALVGTLLELAVIYAIAD